MSKQIVGVFNTEEEAIRVIDQLKEDGYSSDDISVIGKNRSGLDMIEDETGTKAEEGAATGAAAGGMLGGVTGLLAGIGALAIPGVGPIIAAGPIAAALTGAAVGAAGGGIMGGLIGMGIPEDEARGYDEYVQQGKILVLVESDAKLDSRAYDTFRSNSSLNANTYGYSGPVDNNVNIDSRDYNRSDSMMDRAGDAIERGAERTADTVGHAWEKTKDALGNTMDKAEEVVDRAYETDEERAARLRGTSYDSTLTDRPDLMNLTDEERALRLREERLDIDKERVQSGEVTLRKEVIEEQKTINVPVTREEVYVEHHRVTDGQTDAAPISGEEVIRIPVTEERIEVTKRPVVTGEVTVGKREVQETQQVTDTVKREEARLENASGVEVKGDLSFEKDDLLKTKEEIASRRNQR